jgi:hypothetical protein
MCLICHYKRKRGQKNAVYKKNYSTARNNRWVVERTNYDGITDLENCLQDMRRKQ